MSHNKCYYLFCVVGGQSSIIASHQLTLYQMCPYTAVHFITTKLHYYELLEIEISIEP